MRSLRQYSLSLLLLSPASTAFTYQTNSFLKRKAIISKNTQHIFLQNNPTNEIHSKSNDEIIIQGDCQTSISRRKTFQNGLSSIFALYTASISNNANAAIPTMDDYESTTNGAKIVGTNQLSKSQQLLIQTLSQKQTIESKQSLVGLADKLSSSLMAMDSLVSIADWAAVRSVLRAEGQYEGNVLGMTRKSYFGVSAKNKGGSEKALQTIVGPDVDVGKLEDAREDVAFALAELEDFALENRSIFFNSLDRKQVEELIAETGYAEKLSEGKDLLKTAKKSADAFRNVIMSL